MGTLAHQLLRVQPGGGLLIGTRHENAQHRRVDRPGTDGVHPDLLGREPQRQALDEADHAELAHRVDRAKPGAHESRSRGGKEEAAGAPRAHLRNGRLGRDQHRAEIQIDGEIEGAHVDPLHRRRSRMPHMVPDEVQPLEAGHRVPHDPARVLVLRQVRGNPERAPAGGGDLAHHALHARGVHVYHGDLRALAGEAQGSGTAHPRGGGGHDPDLPGEAHGLVLPIRALERRLYTLRAGVACPLYAQRCRVCETDATVAASANAR